MLIRTAPYAKLAAALVLVLTCAGCLKTPISRPKNVKHLTKETAKDIQTKEQVTVYSKTLTDTEQEATFGRSAQRQLKKYDIIPVQLTLENHSTIYWVLSDKNITLNKLTIDEVNTKLFASYRWRPLWIFLGGTALAIIVGPLVGIGIAPLIGEPVGILLNCVGYGLLAAGIIFTTTSCVAVVDGTATHLNKKQMRKYLKDNCSEDGITLAPGITASVLFFVKESKLPSELGFTLIDNDLEKHALNFQMGL